MLMKRPVTGRTRVREAVYLVSPIASHPGPDSPLANPAGGQEHLLPSFPGQLGQKKICAGHMAQVALRSAKPWTVLVLANKGGRGYRDWQAEGEGTLFSGRLRHWLRLDWLRRSEVRRAETHDWTGLRPCDVTGRTGTTAQTVGSGGVKLLLGPQTDTPAVGGTWVLTGA
ncbi:hypothetical protein S40285_10462 [Stachybotrys chlorohalonatus IBT 40285]|uniref:Uncharacterized protein n=1 Tax=Stachybotrys chlorohalonatus (strain IBT 40285) TaxID=1283841 RepID=A0A084QFF7_STAC4|nr:hypothetical protein S40285_10462 [Stachybotrys chlorohalonata IBT 40285]